MDHTLKSRYLKNPNICPFCHSDDLETHSIEQDNITAKQWVTCHGCETEWNDIYQLVDIEEISR